MTSRSFGTLGEMRLWPVYGQRHKRCNKHSLRGRTCPPGRKHSHWAKAVPGSPPTSVGGERHLDTRICSWNLREK